MASPLKPLGDYIVATADEAKTQTASGIYLPSNAAEKPKTATIITVGPGVQGLKAGERIIYKSYSTTDVTVEGTDYILVKEEDVLATVN